MAYSDGSCCGKFSCESRPADLALLISEHEKIIGYH